MSQDELDELFGEEMEVEDSSTIIEEPLRVSKLSDSESESQNSEAEEEELTFTNEINELTLPSIQKPSSQGLIVIIFDGLYNTSLFYYSLFSRTF